VHWLDSVLIIVLRESVVVLLLLLLFLLLFCRIAFIVTDNDSPSARSTPAPR
jgi:hypothetical protein